MSDEKKIAEWRPGDCQSRIGDIVVVEEVRFFKVKCRKCSKAAGQDVFHYLEISNKPSQ